MSPATTNRRGQTRFKASLAVTDGRHATTTRDLSPDGMFVRGLSYAVGERVGLLVQFPDRPVPMRVAADVVRTDAAQGGVGLKLLHSSQAQRIALSAAIVRLAWAKTEPP